MTEPLISVEQIVKTFPVKGGFFGGVKARVHAVNGVSLEIMPGETLGLVGESGCGKSTLGMLLLRLIEPDSGRIVFEGRDLTAMSQRELRPLRRHLQVVFQDPYASLNPRMTIEEIVGEPLIVHRAGSRASRRERVFELLRLVGLSASAAVKYPHEFSGGQRQRVGIARALALTPKLIVADEPVSALDVSIRGEIINLLGELQRTFGLAYLFVSHDLKVVEHASHRVAVMYLGKLMELFPADDLDQARHPYTTALVSAIPIPDPTFKKARIRLGGDVPSPVTIPRGCPFHPRCRFAQDICREVEPAFEVYRDGCRAACHFIRDMIPLAAERSKGGMI